MELSAFRTHLQTWVSAQLSAPTAWVDPAAPQPSPSTTLLVRRISREGQDEQRWEGGPDEVRVVGTRLITVRVLATGGAPIDRLATLQMALSLPSARAALDPALTPTWDGPIEAELSGEAASMEITFRVPVEVLDAPGEIRSADIEGTLRRPDGAVAATESLHFTR